MTDPRDGERLRVAVIGVGAMGTFHARLLSRSVHGVRVSVISDYAENRAARIAEQIPGARVIADPIAAIQADDIDAVVLASPGAAHEEQLRACLARGVPVLCEKPLTTDLSAAAGILAAEEASGHRLIQVGFMRRFDADYAAARQAIIDGEIGQPLILHCVHRNEFVPDSFDSAMMIRDSLVHEMDVTRYLFDEEIAAVRVLKPTATSHAPAGVHDPLLVILETESGRMADCEVFVRAGVGYQVDTEVVGESGDLRFGAERGIQLSTSGTEGGHRRGRISGGFVDRYAAAYHTELQAWADAARHGTITGPNARDGYAAAAACEAAVQALATDGRPVPVTPASAFTDAGGDGILAGSLQRSNGSDTAPAAHQSDRTAERN